MNAFTHLIRTGSLLALAVGTVALGAAPAAAETAVRTACPVVDALPAIAAAQPVDLPPIAAMNQLSGTALVRVDIDATGRPQHPAIVGSSGWASLDAAALTAVLDQRYSPAIHNCRGVAGTFAVAVEF